MSTDVWMVGNVLTYVEGSGQLWVHLNWALSLRDAGCDVTWVELVEEGSSADEVRDAVAALASRLEGFGLSNRLRLAAADQTAAPLQGVGADFVTPEALAEADLLIDLSYWLPHPWLVAARRSALIDIDPGLLQIWIDGGDLEVGPHDAYFTIGETVGTPGAHFPDCGITWHYLPPAVHLPSWPLQCLASPDSSYTTVSHWWEDAWVCFGGDEYQNDKRSSFLQFLDVPRQAQVPVELATNLTEEDADDLELLRSGGWHLRASSSIGRTPTDYRSYIQTSRAEFSCAKPSCMRLQNAWVSDRTLCYLASGRPAVVQNTGPSRILPDASGVLRFRTPAEAVAAISQVEDDYARQCREARALVEEVFDGTRAARSLLERCL